MCGIVGGISCSPLSHNEKKVLKQSLIFDYVRGEHGTGIVHISRENDVSVYKLPADPVTLLADEGVKKAMDGSFRALIGHNRHATMGAINRDNTHPFTVGPISGVHNGTLLPADIHRLLKVLGETSLGNRNDSQLLFEVLAATDIQTVWDEINGAAALVWWDTRDQTMNFIRNSQRPLNFVTSSNTWNDTVYFASEYWMPLIALSRQEFSSHDDWKHTSLKTNTHASVRLTKKRKLHWTNTTMLERPTPVYANRHHGANWNKIDYSKMKWDHNTRTYVPRDDNKNTTGSFSRVDAQTPTKTNLPVAATQNPRYIGKGKCAWCWKWFKITDLTNLQGEGNLCSGCLFDFDHGVRTHTGI